MKRRISVFAGVIAAFLLLPVLGLAGEFVLNGNISAEPSSDPALGSWYYTLDITWDTGTQYGLSHIDLIIDDGSQCSCTEIFESVRWGAPAGDALGYERNCRVQVGSEMNCKGDPSLGIAGSIFKFMPMECSDCTVGVTGTMTVSFYSPFGPAPIADDNLFLVDKFARYSGYGMVTGVFPSLSCNPVSTDQSTWETLKAAYR